MSGTQTVPAAAPTPADVTRWEANLQDERVGHALLQTLAERTRSPVRATAFRVLAEAEAGQAAYWERRLTEAGVPVPPFQPTARQRLLLWLARVVPPRAMLPLVAADAIRGVEAYRAQPDAQPILGSEIAVARAATAMAYGDGAARRLEAGREHRRAVGGNGSLRAAVFGINDGLTSNLSLVMGVAGANVDNQWILLTGLAGLLAGAFSMGGGEFISMLSQRELFEKQLAVERLHIERQPETERENLARIYQEKGLSPSQAEAVAAQLMANPSVALDTIAREALGLDPDELGSPQAAAAASFVSFALGAAIPILPFVFLQGMTAVIAAFIFSGLGLFLVGALLSAFTARHPLVSGLRMMGIGLGAAVVTYLIGRAIGVSVAG